MDEILSISQLPPGLEPSLGERGERMAADLLAANGYRLVCSNFKVPVGRNSKGVQVTGEIDLIALDDETICFVEVKTRRSDAFTPIITNVDRRKQRQIIRTAKVYRRIFNVHDMPHRYDVITVLIPEQSQPRLELIKGFWSEGAFRKKHWQGEAWHEVW